MLLDFLLLFISFTSFIMILSHLSVLFFAKISFERHMVQKESVYLWVFIFLNSSLAYAASYFYMHHQYTQMSLVLFLIVPWFYEMMLRLSNQKNNHIFHYLDIVKNKADDPSTFKFNLFFEDPRVKIFLYTSYVHIVLHLFLKNILYISISYLSIFLLALVFFHPKIKQYRKYKSYVDDTYELYNFLNNEKKISSLMMIDYVYRFVSTNPERCQHYCELLIEKHKIIKSKKADKFFLLYLKTLYYGKKYDQYKIALKNLSQKQRMYKHLNFLKNTITVFLELGFFLEAQKLILIGKENFPEEDKIEELDKTLHDRQTKRLNFKIPIMNIHSIERADYIISSEDYKRGLKKERDYKGTYSMFILNTFNNACAKCLSKESIEMDHFFVPKNEGGCFLMLHRSGQKINNMIPLCKTCNVKKQDKKAHKFFNTKQLAYIFEKQSIINEKINKSI